MGLSRSAVDIRRIILKDFAVFLSYIGIEDELLPMQGMLYDVWQ